MKELFIIIVPQEYDSANHKDLWHTLAKKLEDHMEVLIINIPGDLIVSPLKKRFYRIQEYFRGPKVLSNNLMLLRPLTLLRPEISPRFINKINAFILNKQFEKIIDNYDKRKKYILYYEPTWVELIKYIDPEIFSMYYILDELKLFAHSDMKNSKKIKYDIIACKNANQILTMSKKIANERTEYSKKTQVIGNGALISNNNNLNTSKIPKSVGFVGRFRDWIDFDLLNNLILSRKDLLFCFAGPVEENVRPMFDSLLNNNLNTIYLGEFSKDLVPNIYKLLDVVIVPYKNNNFIRSSRPIKIVESVFSGTPVITIPINGIESTSFIRFATNADDFSYEIDSLLNQPFDINSKEYKEFIGENSWINKSEMIIELMQNK